MTKAKKVKYRNFRDHLLANLKEDDHLVFLHVKEALQNPDLNEKNDFAYLINAINDVAEARGKTDLAEKAGLSRQGLHKILNRECTPNIENILAILNALGLRFSVEEMSPVVGHDNPAKVLDVAEYAASLLSRGSTYMKLQKILYYAQAESLCTYKKPLFNEKIQAWRGGPVVRELYDKHQGYQFLTTIKLGNTDALSIEQKTCVNWAIDKYGKLDGDTLSHLTHVEKPWLEARRSLPEDAPSDNEITSKSIFEYYSSLPKYLDLEEQDEVRGVRKSQK